MVEHYLTQRFTIFVMGAMKYFFNHRDSEDKYERANERLIERLNTFVGGLVQNQQRSVAGHIHDMETRQNNRQDSMEARQNTRQDSMEARQDSMESKQETRHTEMMEVLRDISKSLSDNSRRGIFG